MLGLLQNVVMLSIEYDVVMTDQPDADAGIAELKAGLSDFVNRVIYRRDVVYVTKHGKRVAALVPVEVAERYERERSSAD